MDLVPSSDARFSVARVRTEALPPVAPVLSRQRLRLGTVALVLFAATYASPLRGGPLYGDAARFVRTRLFDYRFTDWDTWRATGNWWTRKEVGPYCPPLTLVNGQLQAVP